MCSSVACMSKVIFKWFQFKLSISRCSRSATFDSDYCSPPHSTPHPKKKKSDVPAPLATKIYYSQRNNRLKSVLTRQFYGASVKELDKDVVIPDVPNNNTMSLEALSHGGSSREQVNDLLHKKVCPC